MIELGIGLVWQDVVEPNPYEVYHRHWAKLHYELNPTSEWFSIWTQTIPGHNCECAKHFKELLEAFPTDFDSPTTFFEWTIFIHNKVNERLSKPIFSLEEAYKLYRPQS